MSRFVPVLAVAGLLMTPALAGARSADFTVVGTNTSEHQKGNRITFTEKLRQGKKVVGIDKVSCAGPATALVCTGTYTFNDGTITVRGTVSQAKRKNVVQIAGGTGAYKGARGKVTLNFTSQTTTTESFHFS